MKRELKELEPLQEYFTNRKDIMSVYLFGSTGTEWETETSDLDLAILFSRKLSLMEELEVEAELALLLPEREIDLLNLNRGSVIIQHKVLVTGELIYERDPLYTADFKEKTLKLYFDYGLTYKKMQEDFLEALREEHLS